MLMPTLSPGAANVGLKQTGGFYMRAILPVLFMMSAISTTAFAGAPGEIEVGGYLREAKLNGFSGKTKKFSDYKGKPLIINVWASWCGPCRAEMGSLERLARRYGGKQFNVIGISTDDDGNAAAAYIKQSGVTFENYLDSHVFLENMLGANAIPLTVLVDAHGRVLAKVRGAREWDNPEIISAIGETFRIKLPR
jgi:thiol-disulfide isomerase/thioredoxin